MVEIDVVAGDAMAHPCDVLVLKHAQAFYGVDAAVARVIVEQDGQMLVPAPTGFRLFRPQGLGAAAVLFVGVPPLQRFLYDEIEQLVVRALTALAGECGTARRVAFTLHGPGYGLDELACMDSMLRGFEAALDSGSHPEALERIEIVELDLGRAERLSRYMAARASYARASADAPADAPPSLASSPTVFAAVPFAEDYEDTYNLGLQAALHDLGLKVERIDQQVFVGDVVQQIRRRIARSRLVVADLSGASANVFLEVGYAWGCEVPTVLLVRESEMERSLKFDVQGQRCLVYRNITDLKDKLASEIPEVLAST